MIWEDFKEAVDRQLKAKGLSETVDIYAIEVGSPVRVSQVVVTYDNSDNSIDITDY